jgi:hypothetical protein
MTEMTRKGTTGAYKVGALGKRRVYHLVSFLSFVHVTLFMPNKSHPKANIGSKRLPKASKIGSQNPPKSIKNRCQEAIHLELHFLIVFSLIFGANFDPKNLKNH